MTNNQQEKSIKTNKENQVEMAKLSNPSTFRACAVVGSIEQAFNPSTSFGRYHAQEAYEYYVLAFARAAFANVKEIRDKRIRIYKVDIIGNKKDSLGMLFNEEKKTLLYELLYNEKTNEIEQVIK